MTRRRQAVDVAPVSSEERTVVLGSSGLTELSAGPDTEGVRTMVFCTGPPTGQSSMSRRSSPAGSAGAATAASHGPLGVIGLAELEDARQCRSPFDRGAEVVARFATAGNRWTDMLKDVYEKVYNRDNYG